MKPSSLLRLLCGTTAVVLAVFVALAVGSVAPAVATPLTIPDPGCVASAAAPRVATVCLNEAHEGSTAAGFSSHACDHILGTRDTTKDYFIFVLPASGDPSRFFSGTPTVYYTTNGTTTLSTAGVIDTNNKFFSASTPAGATVLEAVALSNNLTGTPKGGEAQSFNLTHTCPASTTPPPDTTPPTCKLTATLTGPPKAIQITVQDTGSGPASIILTSSSNATTSPSLPLYFTVEDTAPFVITATKVDQTKPSTIALKVTDLAGNVTVCDPVWKANRAAVARAARAHRIAALAARLR